MNFEPNSNEEAAYKCGICGEIPMPQIIMSESMLDAWKHGMDERERTLNEDVSIRQLAKNDPATTFGVVIFLIALCCLSASITAYAVIRLMGHKL